MNKQLVTEFPSNPLVTVFMSCRNQAQFLPQAIGSVLGQSFDDFELLLYDDASEDKTGAIMREAERIDGRVRFIEWHQHAGVATLINHSVSIARGMFWVWCPADDMLWIDCLARKYQHSAVLMHQAVIYSRGMRIKEDETPISVIAPPKMSPEEFRDVIWRECPIGFTGIWIPKHVFATVGPFPEDLAYSEDYCWMLRAAGRGVDFQGLDEVLYMKRIHDGQTATKYAKDIIANVQSIRERVRQELKSQ